MGKKNQRNEVLEGESLKEPVVYNAEGHKKGREHTE